jgi:hypothetical protein
MATSRDISRQKLTLSLSKETIRKAKGLAARRGISVSALLASQIEILVAKDAAYESAKRQALLLLEQGLHLGGAPRCSLDELHER